MAFPQLASSFLRTYSYSDPNPKKNFLGNQVLEYEIKNLLLNKKLVKTKIPLFKIG